MSRIRRYISFFIFILLISLSWLSFAVEAESLEIGDLINFGKYYNEPILWQVIDYDDNGNPLLLSKNIIDLKPFDAAGSKHAPDGYYNWAQYYGSNQWETSTLRQWLNSTRRNIKWDLNPPSEENVFKGINAYDNEAGFLHRQNFSISQRNIIKKSKLGDKVFLLSHDEYKEYYSNMDFFPLFTPTIGALDRSDYLPRGIKSGLAYDILTRDAIVESPHALMAFKAPDHMVTSIASFGDKGLAPAMYLDMDKIALGDISGEGSILNPYEIKVGFPINILIGVAVTLLVIILLLVIIKKRRASLMILFISLSLLTACQPESQENHLESYNKPKVIVLSYAKNRDLILQRLDDFFNNSESEFLIIDRQGKDQSQWAISHYGKPSTEEELIKIQKDLSQDGFWIVKGGDFRLTTMKDEIDSVFEEIGLIVSNRPISQDPRSKFVEDMKPLHEEGDYNTIIKYLEDHQYTILHPYDFFSYGIGILEGEFDN